MDCGVEIELDCGIKIEMESDPEEKILHADGKTGEETVHVDCNVGE